MAQQPYFGEPYQGPMSDDQMVDHLIGNAYAVVKFVAERMHLVRAVSYQSVDIGILASNIPSINALGARALELSGLYAELNKLLVIYPELPALLDLHADLSQLLLIPAVKDAVLQAAQDAGNFAEQARLSSVAAQQAVQNVVFPTQREVTLAYGAGGAVAWPADQGNVATLVASQNPTTIQFPTGLVGDDPLGLTLIIAQNATGGYVTDFAEGFFVKKATDVSPNTYALYNFVKRGNMVIGGVVSQGIPVSGTPVGPVIPEVPAAVAPASLTSSNIGSVSISLNWTASANAARYNIYRSGNKVNLNVITGVSFTDVGLTPATEYTYVVKAVSADGVESAASPALVRTTAAAPGIDYGVAINGIYPTPRKVNGIYAEWYHWGRETADDIPEQVNTVYLFNIQPLGAAVNGTRDNVGDGTFTNSSFDNPAFSPAKLRALHASGKRLIITAGGAKAGFNFNSRDRSIKFLASFKAVVAQTGAIISGIDWNTFEAYLREVSKAPGGMETLATNTAEMIWISQQLRDYYGPNFSISMPPAPSAFPFNGDAAYSPYDYVVAKALYDANLLNWIAPQFYEDIYIQTPGRVTARIGQWIEKFPQEMIAVGLSHGNRDGNFNDCLTLAQAEREALTINANWPNNKGFFTWSLHDKIDATFPVYLASMTEKFRTANNGGSPPVVVVPPPVVVVPVGNESALTNALSGQTGAWITPAPAYLQKAAGVLVTNSGNAVVQMMDRSGGANHLIKDPLAVATYGLDGTKGFVDMNAGFTSQGGGGHADTNANGFFLYHVAKLTSDYPYLWMDSTSINNGIRVVYEGYLGKVRVSIGTANGSYDLLSQLIAPVNTAPNSVVRTKVWVDATTLYLQVNGGTVFSMPVGAIIPGDTNFRINGTFNPLPGYSTQDLYSSFHTLNPLTESLRNGVVAYIDSIT